MELRNTTQYPIPTATKNRFKKIAATGLGGGYELSVVICGDSLSRSLNKTHRKKDKIANVLSFPLDERLGELFLNPRQAQREAHLYDRSPKEHLVALFAHGVAHLAGYDHGKAMEKLEAKLLKT